VQLRPYGHDEPATRTCGLAEVSKGRYRIREEHHPESGDHGVIGSGREVVTRCVADDPFDLGSRYALTCGRDHRRRDVDTSHRTVGTDRLPGLAGGGSRADADIEYAFARLQGGSLEQCI
jgi:hypothetical protein